MSRYESGFDRRTKSAVVGSQIHERNSENHAGSRFPEATPQNEGLTNQDTGKSSCPGIQTIGAFF